MSGPIDASAKGGSTSTTTAAVTLTTSATNDVIVVYVLCESNSTSSAPTVTGVSGASLSWTRRWAQTYVPGSSQIAMQLECWWAAAASTLSSQTITATLSGTADAACIVAVAVTGCANLSNPWEPDGQCPSVIESIAGGFLPVYSTTSNTNSVGFYIGGAVGGGAGGPCNPYASTVPGVSGGLQTENQTGSVAAGLLVAYSAWTSPQNTSGTGGPYGAFSNIIVTDALTVASSAVSVPAVDLASIMFTTGYGASSLNPTVVTRYPNEMICIFSSIDALTSTPPPTISTITATGLTFTKRTTAYNSPVADGAMYGEFWTAPCATPGSYSITITYSGAAPDGMCVIGWGVTGVGNTALPFDVNGSLPGLVTSSPSSPWTPTISGISTTGAHDLLLYMAAIDSSTPSTTEYPTGWTLISNEDQSASTNYAGTTVAFLRVSSAQSSLTITSANSIANYHAMPGGSLIIDAFLGSGGGGGGGGGNGQFAVTIISG